MLFSSFFFAAVLLVSSTFAEVAQEQKCKPSMSSMSCMPASSSSSSTATAAAEEPAKEPESPATRKCTSHLEKIIYVPQSGAYDYLDNIMNIISVNLAGTFDVYQDRAAINVLQVLAAQFQVSIVLQPFFGDTPNIILRPNGQIAPSHVRISGHLIAPTYLNQRGYQSVHRRATTTLPEARVYSMAAVFINNFGVGYTIIINLISRSVFADC